MLIIDKRDITAFFKYVFKVVSSRTFLYAYFVMCIVPQEAKYRGYAGAGRAQCGREMDEDGVQQWTHLHFRVIYPTVNDTGMV